LPYAVKVPPAGRPALRSDGAAKPERIEVPAGRAVLGADPKRVEFGWDNEFPQQSVDVPAFTIDATPVRNQEYLEFVESGGYGDRALWSEEAWAWIQRRGIQHPNAWRRAGDGWIYLCLFDPVPLDRVADWPVYVSWAEAQAYVRWRGAELPTEPEFHRAAYGTPGGEVREHPWGAQPPEPRHGNFDWQCWAPTPVGSYPEGQSAWGVHELVGNGWEWTGTPFRPYPGFRVTVPSYPGYSADFYDDRHYVMLGASWATDRKLLRRSYRNWFQPHYPYVWAKFRCVERRRDK
jgi:formylglycine-generating enzyme required for sulfatase activity